MSISFDGHIPRLNISTPSLCNALYKMFEKSPETDWTISMDNVHMSPWKLSTVQLKLSTVRVHGQCPLSESMDNVNSVHENDKNYLFILSFKPTCVLSKQKFSDSEFK